MLTTISKCLAVFIAVASLLFLGFAVISTAAGPNWQADVEDLREFTFTKTVSETGTTWSVKSRTDESFSKTGILPEAVVAARKNLKQYQDARITFLNQQIEGENARLTGAKELIEVDLKAIDKRIEQMQADLADIEQQILVKTAEGTRVAEEISQVQADTETRREEVIRLQAQLKEIRADKFRTVEQQKRLTDLLARITGNIDRLERRYQQLKQRLTPYEEKPSPESTDAGA